MTPIYPHIATLYHRYAALIDAGKLEEVASLLKHCTILDPSGNVMAQGQSQILDMYRTIIRIYPDNGTPHTHHIVSNLSVNEGDPGAATAAASYSVIQKMKSGELQTIICGEYNSKFELKAQEWCFVEHQMTPKLIGDMSEHITIDLGSL